QVDVARRDAGRLERALRGLECEVAGRLAFRRDVALLDPGPLLDPFVRRVDEFRQVGIGQHLLRQIAAGARDTRIDQGRSPAGNAKEKRADSSGPRVLTSSYVRRERRNARAQSSVSSTLALVTMTCLP